MNRNFLLGIIVGVFLMCLFIGGAMVERVWGIRGLDRIASGLGIELPAASNAQMEALSRTVLNEESYVISVAEQSSPAVVTVGIKKTQTFLRGSDPFFDPFGFFRQQQPSIGERQIERDIGSGFVVKADGLVVTNRHVVQDRDAEYVVITKDGQEYPVEQIDRDPLNDLAILKITASNLPTLALGDSEQLKVGQSVIAIGTALGEFRHTVTTGVISGLGRGIVARDGFRQAEELDNVIQTDAAINPGNSGGPLLNSAGQVIGVNVAVASGSENIGFALPINLVKEALEQFETRGGFGSRAYMGVSYSMVSERAAILNEVPQGAYLEEVVADSAAGVGGLRAGDIVTKFDGQDVKDADNGLAGLISQKRVGDRVEVEYWRDGESHRVTVELKGAE